MSVTDAEWRAMRLKGAKVRLAFSRLARRHANRCLAFLDEGGRLVLVHRTTEPHSTPPWRVTYFDNEQEPNGHTYEKTHRAAVFAAREYGARPETATLP